jgi:ribose transport system substrate-binding protein
MKKLVFVVLLLTFVLGFGAAQAQEPRVITIGLSWNERIQSLVQAWQDYMEQYSAEFGAKWNVQFEWVVNVADSDPVRQNANIQDLITQGVDVIVARPADSEAIGAAITAANEAGIPFITFDRRSTSTPATSHVGADSLNQAISTGETFAALLAENGVQGQCIELQGDLVDTNAVFRSQGWNQVAESSGQYTTIVQVPTEWQAENFRTGLANALAANPDANCIFVASDFAFNGVRAALEEAGRYFPQGDPNHMWIAAQDVNPQGYEAMLGGFIDVATTYDAYFHSVELVNVAVRVATGDIVQPQYLVPGRVATPATLPDMEFIWARDYSD